MVPRKKKKNQSLVLNCLHVMSELIYNKRHLGDDRNHRTLHRLPSEREPWTSGYPERKREKKSPKSDYRTEKE